jgi:hypothetical protein
MNLYVTPDEIKSAAPDLIRSTTTKYDDPLYRRCVSVSRAIDRRCKRHFYPRAETRYYAGSGNGILWVDDLVSVSSVAISTDGGKTYTTLAADDYYGAVSENFNSPCSYNMLILSQDGSWMGFPRGMRSVRIRGEWGYTDDRAACWEGSAIHLEAGMTAEATTLTIEDGIAQDLYGLGTFLQLGRLIRIGAEMLFVQAVTINQDEDDVVTVVRGQNGSEAAAHEADEEIFLWRPPFDISQAAMISAVRDLARAQQGYVDTRGGLEVGGQMLWVGRWDPEAEDKISRYVRTGIG